MTCDACKKKPACVFITQAIDGEVRKLQLCATCAAQQNIPLHAPVDLPELLQGLAAPVPGKDPRCPACGCKWSAIQHGGRLGCAECYVSFGPGLETLIAAQQPGPQHKGRRPPQVRPVTPARSDLLRAMQEALAEERYEDAARLRDRLAALPREPAS